MQVNYSATVMLGTAKQVGNIEVYPNPVINDRLYTRFTEETKGVYLLSLANTAWQTIYNAIIDHEGGTAVNTSELGHRLP